MKNTRKLLRSSLLISVMLLTGCGETPASSVAAESSVASSEPEVSSVASSSAAPISVYDIGDYKLTFKDPDGNLMKNMDVTLSDGEGYEDTLNTENHGYVEFEGIDKKNYTLTVDVPDDYSYCGFKTLTFNPKKSKQTFTAVTKVSWRRGTGLSEDQLTNSTTISVYSPMYDFTCKTTEYAKDDNGDYILDPEDNKKSYNETTWTLSDLIGGDDGYQLIYLNFWATWCSPCKSEFPVFNQLYNETDEDGNYTYRDKVKFLCISCEETDTESVIAEFKETNGYDFDMGFMTSSNTTAAKVYNAAATGYIPLNLFIDRDGQVMNIESGAVTSLTTLKSIVDPYLGTDEEYAEHIEEVKKDLEENYIVDWGDNA